MILQPQLQTERLLLRPFHISDGPGVKELAGDQRIAATTLHIPHPYPEGVAELWISRHTTEFLEGRSITYAICEQNESVVGAIGLSIQPKDRKAELGYWIGVDYWNRGYCTEAGRAVLDFAIKHFSLEK